MRYFTEPEGYGLSKKRLFFEKGYDNAATIAIDETGKMLIVSVSQEKAVDSYNDTFECSVELSFEEAAKLRDALNEWFPKNPPQQPNTRRGVQ